jgi:glucose-1-phosphate cytidylyltransferase
LKDSDNIMWEEGPLHQLTRDNQLMAYRHLGFWKSMDILRDKIELETHWQNGAPWKVWE